MLVRARTYMNETGGAVKQLASFYKVPTERIVAVHDELDLPFDTMRVKLGGGDNGHNGVRSMRAALGTGDFYRVRIGIGRPSGRQDVADFVLSNYSATERKDLPLQVVTAADAVESLVTEGLAATQSTLQLLRTPGPNGGYFVVSRGDFESISVLDWRVRPSYSENGRYSRGGLPTAMSGWARAVGGHAFAAVWHCHKWFGGAA